MSEAMACPDENVLAQLASGGVAVALRPELEAHLDGCSDCRALVAAVAGGSNPPAPLTLEPVVSEGDVLGRYRIERQLGAGGMGVLYAAHDVRLDRRVALKLIHPGLQESSGKARLRREAQAMARLNHPNVAGLYDLGEHKGRFFLAMELVEGGTLRDWMKESHSTREVLVAFSLAGEGLAAAHKAGVVHRDFKPENVLIGQDGRVRVTDFGLSRPLADRAGKAAAPITALTHVGALVGTLAYMSPEQLAADPADERSDQYAFCVALHEALFGMRPHPDARTPDELRAAQLAQPPVRPAGKDDVPQHVWEAIARGLSFDASKRFSSMDSLLRALRRKPPRSEWLKFLPLGAAITIATAVLGYGALLGASKLGNSEPAPVQLTLSSNPKTRVTVLKPNGQRVELGEVPIDRARGATVGDTVVMINQDLGITYEEKIQFGQPNENWVRVRDFAQGKLKVTLTGGSTKGLTIWRGTQLVASNPNVSISLYEGIQRLELRGDPLRTPVPFEVKIEPNMINTALIDVGAALNP
jgi:eukaryotic-like serine/threonine-protein kinase